ncbi:MAG: hypothetical protein HRU14_08280, partial [Planctomycetes bacterium]|nr:hypothetical protein [Planctomycetota bacterium]
MPKGAPRIAGAEVVLPCRHLDETLAFLCDRLGFRVLAVYPADAPTVAVVERGGLRVRLDGEAGGAPGVLRLLCDDPVAVGDGETEFVAPNGTRIDLVNADVAPVIPPLQASLVVTRLQGDAGWSVGRAGMRYRDLVPDRQGGRFIASHIQIPGGGAGADDAYTLIAKVIQATVRITAGVLVVPAAGMKGVALEVVDARDARELRPVQRPVGHGDKAG